MTKYHLHDNKVDHSHDDDHCANHGHHHNIDYAQLRKSSTKTLKVIMIFTLSFAFVEAIGGWLSGSLALISDALHMVTDSASLFIALWMAKISQIPADNNHSYGHGRADTLGAFINGLFMLGIIVFIGYEAINRIINPQPVNGFNVMIIASIGLMINIVAAYLLHKNSHSLNTKAAFIHVLGDLLGSVAAIVAGIIIYFTGMNIVDPILSLIISAILIAPTFNLLKKSSHILMEGVPEDINYEKVGKSLSSIKGVISIHDLHIWTMNSNNTALSAHVLINEITDWDKVLEECQKMLSHHYDIGHVTLQPELVKPQKIEFIKR